MEKTTDRAYEFKGTSFHLRAFEDPFNAEKPVYVLEAAPGSETSLDINRVEIAKELADKRGRTPEQITWLEQSPDGALKQIEFEYTHTDKIVPGASDMAPEELESVLASGNIEPLDVDRYNIHEMEASRQDFQAQVGDALEPYEKRMNEEFRKMEGPAVVVGIDEVPTQDQFENDPDLTF